MRKTLIGAIFVFIGINLFANNLNYFIFKTPVIKIQKVEKHKGFSILFFNFKKDLKNGNRFSSCLINKVKKLPSNSNYKNYKYSISDNKYDYYLFCVQPNSINSYITKLNIINPVLINNMKKNNNELFLEKLIYKIKIWNGLGQLKRIKHPSY